VNYLVQSNPSHELDKWSVVKLAYLADRYHLRKYGRTVSGDLYVAMKKGPVGSLIKDVVECTDYLGDGNAKYVKSFIQRKDTDTNIITSASEVDLDQFSKTDMEALDFAIKNFSQYSKEELIEITHKYPEWSKFESRLNADSAQEKMDYQDFFLNPKDYANDLFVENETLLASSREMYSENEKNSQIFAE
jgi:uncharacterized phage-associated protein